MKLELKHLAPYLPYGLKVYDLGCRKILCELNIENIEFLSRNFYTNSLILPILRPLSDLMKDITIGNDIINFQDLFKEYNFEWLITSNNKSKLINSLDYFIVKKMIEYHFDIYGLIEQGLAIDINTIE